MNLISVDERLPDKEDCGREFLCVIKECTYFQKYEIAEWFNPMNDDCDEPLEDWGKPYFSIENKFCGQQSLNREVTHWMELPKLLRLK